MALLTNVVCGVRHATLLKDNVPPQLEMELARLDDILHSISPGVQDGDLQAVDRALKVSMRRARLLGLDRKPSEEDPAGEKRKDSPPLNVYVYPPRHDQANENSE